MEIRNYTDIFSSFSDRRLFAMACKSTPKNFFPATWSERYEKMGFRKLLEARLFDAARFRPSDRREEKQMEKILLHRSILADYAERIVDCKSSSDETSSLVQSLQKHLEELSNPNSCRVLFDGAGRSSFCMPGGSFSHAVCYEFARENDGSYTFLIYNKGEGWNDRDLHGGVLFEREGIHYLRSRVQIRGLKKQDLQDKVFLAQLIELQNREEAKMTHVYEAIKKHLLGSCGGWVRKAKAEAEWEHLMSLPTNTPEQAKRRAQLQEELYADDDFHGAQVFGTCTESNAQTPEHFLASSMLRRKLKLHSIKSALEESSLTDLILQSMVDKKIRSLRAKIHEEFPPFGGLDHVLKKILSPQVPPC